MTGLADMIENGDINSGELILKLKIALRNSIDHGDDAIALGYTYYGFLDKALNQILPTDVLIFNPANAGVRRIIRFN